MYAHTQRSPLMAAFLGISALAAVVPVLFYPDTLPLGAKVTVGAAAVVMMLCALAFSSLTITVDDQRLAWRYGPGVLKRSVPLAEVTAVERTQTSFVEGWGIHLTMRGWLYNVSGRDAVLVTLRPGRTFMLGTDEPEALMRAIREGAARG